MRKTTVYTAYKQGWQETKYNYFIYFIILHYYSFLIKYFIEKVLFLLSIILWNAG